MLNGPSTPRLFTTGTTTAESAPRSNTEAFSECGGSGMTLETDTSMHTAGLMPQPLQCTSRRRRYFGAQGTPPTERGWPKCGMRTHTGSSLSHRYTPHRAGVAYFYGNLNAADDYRNRTTDHSAAPTHPFPTPCQPLTTPRRRQHRAILPPPTPYSSPFTHARTPSTPHYPTDTRSIRHPYAPGDTRTYQITISEHPRQSESFFFRFFFLFFPG